MTTEVPVTVNKDYPTYIKDDRFSLKKQRCGNRLIYEIKEKTPKGENLLGSCRIFWKMEKGKETIPIAKIWAIKDEKLNILLNQINEILLTEIGTQTT